MAAPQPQTHREMSKSITRILQHSILQLCNEHIGYSHKLQILGVLCMTVDDEQQEIVVKVNNTLKRVNPILGKDGCTASPSVEPASQMTGSILPVTVEDQSIHIGDVRSLSPAHSTNGRKGRKPNNPVRVQQVYQDPSVIAEDDLGGEEEPVTIIPEAPEESMDSQGLSDSELLEGDETSQTATQVGAAKQRMMGALSELKASGSARRKASQPMRDPQYASSSPSSSDNANSKVNSVEKEFGAELDQAAQDAANNLTDIAESDASQNLSISSTAQKGLSLPIYVPGGSGQPRYGHPVPRIAPTAVTIGPLPSNAINLSQGFSQAQFVSNLSKNAIFSTVNGTPEKEPGSSPNGPQGTSTPQRLPQSRFYIDSDADGTIKVKEEPRDDYEYECGTTLDSSGTSMNDSTTFSISDSFSITNNIANRANQNSVLNLSGGGITSIPYNLGLVPTLSGASIGGKKDGTQDGLSIRYTSTGPITVGANGRDVSNNSRIKDIILYNESAFTGQTKGAATRIETDYVIDKMGVEGRKRRRRAVDDLFTQEELAEYLGTGGTKSGLFKCQYCKEDYDDITKYIQHTLGAHSTYICHQCGKSFTTKSSLLRHRPIHTGMRRFACSICKKTFYRKDKCKAHIKRHLGTGDSDVVPHIETSPIQMELPVAE